MKNFIYTGSQPHNSTILVDPATRETKDIQLAQGDEQMLQEDHPVIASMIGSGLLVEKQVTSSKKNS